MRLGDTVKVVKRGDETFPKNLLFQTGRVIRFDNVNCGATPKDPMVIVEFHGGVRDGFWLEELQLA